MLLDSPQIKWAMMMAWPPLDGPYPPVTEVVNSELTSLLLAATGVIGFMGRQRQRQVSGVKPEVALQRKLGNHKHALRKAVGLF
jgi:hypothetical protein